MWTFGALEGSGFREMSNFIRKTQKKHESENMIATKTRTYVCSQNRNDKPIMKNRIRTSKLIKRSKLG